MGNDDKDDDGGANGGSGGGSVCVSEREKEREREREREQVMGEKEREHAGREREREHGGEIEMLWGRGEEKKRNFLGLRVLGSFFFKKTTHLNLLENDLNLLKKNLSF